MPVTRATLALALALSAPAAARAYSGADRFELDPSSGGGGGRRFTGSPADGFTCEVCHTGGRRAEFEVAGFPTGGYRPGEQYAIEIAWPEGAAAAFALEVVDASGAAAGVLALPPAEEIDRGQRCASGTADPPRPAAGMRSLADGRTVAAVEPCEAERASLRWTAPAADTGAVFLYAGGVIGDGSGTAEGDGTDRVVRSAALLGAPPPEASVLEAGCAAAGGRPAGGGRAAGQWALPWLALLLLRRRRPSRADQGQTKRSRAPVQTHEASVSVRHGP